MTEEKRAFEMSIEIAASREEVWRALTEAEELVRWFPLGARVTPGPGGSMLWTWEDAWSWETRIDAWEPPRFLRLVDELARPYDADGRPLPEGEAAPARIVMEFTLETRKGKTSLRLVHSGFGHGAGWDDELDGVSHGWQFELRSLRHYLERHRGRDRRAAWAHVTTAAPLAAAWKTLVGPGGFVVTPAPTVGRSYTMSAPSGDRFTGAVELYLPERDFFGTVRELDDGVFRLGTWRAGGRTGVMVWLASYAGDATRVRAFEQRAREVLGRLFPGHQELVRPRVAVD